MSHSFGVSPAHKTRRIFISIWCARHTDAQLTIAASRIDEEKYFSVDSFRQAAKTKAIAHVCSRPSSSVFRIEMSDYCWCCWVGDGRPKPKCVISHFKRTALIFIPHFSFIPSAEVEPKSLGDSFFFFFSLYPVRLGRRFITCENYVHVHVKTKCG